MTGNDGVWDSIALKMERCMVEPRIGQEYSHEMVTKLMCTILLYALYIVPVLYAAPNMLAMLYNNVYENSFIR